MASNYVKNFAKLPNVKYRRSMFDLPFRHKTTFNLGELIPVYWQDVSPGDSFKIDCNMVLRLTSQLVKPIFDNLFLDCYFFFIPNRLTDSRWAEVMGENPNPWARSSYPEVPKIVFNDGFGKARIGSLFDYFGVPSGETQGVTLDGLGISLLPFNAYAKIWNDWFRDENLQYERNIYTNPTSTVGGYTRSISVTANGYVFAGQPNYYMYMPLKVNKIHDYFTSCLPAPQKGASVNIPLGGTAPVFAGDVDFDDVKDKLTESLRFANYFYSGGARTDWSIIPSSNTLTFVPSYGTASTGEPSGTLSVATVSGVVGDSGAYYAPYNLQADLSSATAINVNDWRYLVALQRMLEKDARGGTRYVEFLREHFGVVSPDARLQRSEFLGGTRIPVNINQVVQTSATVEDSAQGNVSAFSLSNGSTRFQKGFVEHGIVMGVVCVRQFHTYQQGLNKRFRRFKRTDFYDPVFNNLGEQPVYTSELFLGGGGSTSDLVDLGQVFGYNEAWADYRCGESRISGALRSSASGTLDVWHLGDKYLNAPTLTQEFIEETPVYLDRALAVPHTEAPQFLLDCLVNNRAIRVMTPYSNPSLVNGV